jgi:hypothetical protein
VCRWDRAASRQTSKPTAGPARSGTAASAAPQYRTDVSHLPELRAYLNQLLVAQEELADANPNIAEWARREAMPCDEEIATVRRLVDACEALLDNLPDDERRTPPPHRNPSRILTAACRHRPRLLPQHRRPAGANVVPRPRAREVVCVTERLLEVRRADVAARTQASLPTGGSSDRAS